MDANKIGVGRQYDDATACEEAEHGKYTPNVPEGPSADPLLPTKAMPKAPDPSPFSLGSMGKR